MGWTDSRLELFLKPDPGRARGMITIYFQYRHFAFPSVEWTDFSYLPNAWLEGLSGLDGDGYCEMWFADRPYQVKRQLRRKSLRSGVR